MKSKRIIWPVPIREKLLTFRSEHFTAEETYDYLIQFIFEVEDLLLNPVLGKTYREESGEYKGIQRLVNRKFRIYYE